MITKITGHLAELSEYDATIAVDPFEYEVLVPEFTRRQLQLHVGEDVRLYTIEYIDGNIQKGGRMTPRLIGFTTKVEREFFELFCSVDGVGVKKALRAMVRPVQDVARAIEQQDIKAMSTMPGIGAATAERIVAKLRRKMAKFALMVPREVVGDGQADGDDVFETTYQILVNLGHPEAEARQLLEGPLRSKKKFKDVDALLQCVYEQVQEN